MAYEAKPGSRVDKSSGGMHQVVVHKDESEGKGYFPEQNLKRTGYTLNEALSDGFTQVYEKPQSEADKATALMASTSEKRLREMPALDLSGVIGAKAGKDTVEFVEED